MNPNPNDSSDQGKTDIRIRCEDQKQGLAGHVTIGQEGLRQLGWSGDVMAEVGWMQGTQWDSGGRSSTYTHRGRDDEAGTEGGQPPINGLGVGCLNRHWS